MGDRGKSESIRHIKSSYSLIDIPVKLEKIVDLFMQFSCILTLDNCMKMSWGQFHLTLYVRVCLILFWQLKAFLTFMVFGV